MLDIHPDWRGNWRIVLAYGSHDAMKDPEANDVLLKEFRTPKAIVGYDVITYPRISDVWKNTFLIRRGVNPPPSVKIVDPTSTLELERASTEFRDQLDKLQRRDRNRLVRLEGDITVDGHLQLVELFYVENAIMGSYPAVFAVLDEDGGSMSPDGSAVAIRR